MRWEGPLLGPPACPGLVCVLGSDTWAVLAPRHHSPSSPACSAPPGGPRGPPSHLHLLVSGPQQKLTFFNSTLNIAGLEPEGEDLPIPGAHRPGVVTKAGLILFGNDGRMVRVLLQLLVCAVGSGPAGRLQAILEETGKGVHRIQEGRASPAGSASVPGRPALGSYWPGALPELGALWGVRVEGSCPDCPMPGRNWGS